MAVATKKTPLTDDQIREVVDKEVSAGLPIPMVLDGLAKLGVHRDRASKIIEDFRSMVVLTSSDTVLPAVRVSQARTILEIDREIEAARAAGDSRLVSRLIGSKIRLMADQVRWEQVHSVRGLVQQAADPVEALATLSAIWQAGGGS